MKNLLTKIVPVVALLTILVPTIASANTDVHLSSSNIQVTTGHTFTVTVSIDPTTDTVYTGKLALSYPADVVSITSFSFGSKWLPLSEQGYDLMDNTNGQLVKTAGYPGGLKSATTFGTITFTALKTGTATITTNTATQVFDGTNQNVFSGNPQTVTVTIGTKTVTTTESVKTTPALTSTSTTTAQTASTTAVTTASTTSTNNNQVAAVIASGANTSRNIAYGIIALLVIAGAVWFWNRRKV